MLYLGFNAGGYFAGTTGWATVALALVLAIRIAVSGDVLAAPGRPLLLAGGGLAMFALWTLLSGGWGENYARALIEFDRTLLYLLVLGLFGSLAQPSSAFRFLPLGFAFAAVVLCAAGLATRVLPDQWPFDLPTAGNRLAYPISYSNGLGILATLAIVLCLHIASWERERAAVRILAAAALPLVAATLVLTFSRGAILAGAVGLVLYAVLGRPRGLPTSLLATVPFVVLAAAGAYGADLLAAEELSLNQPAALEQGRELARKVGLSMLGAGLGLALLIPLERRLIRVASSRRPSRRLLVALGTMLALGTIAAAVAVAPDAYRSVREDIQGADGGSSREEPLTRDRLLRRDVVDFGGQSRARYWRVSLRAFEQEPLRGTGVGTFSEQWARQRPNPESVTEGHSVYLETLGELGLVGLVLLVLVLGLSLAALAVGLRGHHRPLYAAALAAFAAWMIHAGIDWDWELPAVTVWLFAFAGCALAGWSERERRARAPGPGWRAIAACACLLVAVTPAAVAVSQSRLDSSVVAFLNGDCASAEAFAASASSVLPPRAEPYEILAYCASLGEEHSRALRMMREALDRDPVNWELAYGLARVRAAAGEDPRAAVRRLRRMNPLEPLTDTAIARFTGGGPPAWRRGARNAPLPLP